MSGVYFFHEGSMNSNRDSTSENHTAVVLLRQETVFKWSAVMSENEKCKPFTVRCGNIECDWGWGGNFMWVVTSKEDSAHWDEAPFCEMARMAILNHFGLDDRAVSEKLPLETLRSKSPSELVAMRREFERKFNLHCLEIRCQRSGGEHILAEESRIEVAA